MPKNSPIDRRMSVERLENDKNVPLCQLESGQPPSVGNCARLDRFIRISEVRHHTSLSTSTLYRKMRDGTFPQNRELGPNTVAWYESDVAAWMQNPT